MPYSRTPGRCAYHNVRTDLALEAQEIKQSDVIYQGSPETARRRHHRYPHQGGERSCRAAGQGPGNYITLAPGMRNPNTTCDRLPKSWA